MTYRLIRYRTTVYLSSKNWDYLEDALSVTEFYLYKENGEFRAEVVGCADNLLNWHKYVEKRLRGLNIEYREFLTKVESEDDE